jgi:hypothetical protein
MQTKLFVPVLAAGLALSASVFGQKANADVGWTRSTASDSMAGANKYSPNTYRAEKTQAREQKTFQHQQQFAKAESVIEGGSYSLGLVGSRVNWSQAESAKSNQPNTARSAKMNPPNSSQTKVVTPSARQSMIRSALRKSAVLGGL